MSRPRGTKIPYSKADRKEASVHSIMKLEMKPREIQSMPQKPLVSGALAGVSPTKSSSTQLVRRLRQACTSKGAPSIGWFVILLRKILREFILSTTCSRDGMGHGSNIRRYFVLVESRCCRYCCCYCCCASGTNCRMMMVGCRYWCDKPVEMKCAML